MGIVIANANSIVCLRPNLKINYYISLVIFNKYVQFQKIHLITTVQGGIITNIGTHFKIIHIQKHYNKTIDFTNKIHITDCLRLALHLIENQNLSEQTPLSIIPTNSPAILKL